MEYDGSSPKDQNRISAASGVRLAQVASDALPEPHNVTAAHGGVNSDNNDDRNSPATNDSTTTAGQPREQQPGGTRQPQEYSEHAEGETIRNQVEYYFSDENLPSDAHLLMKTGGTQNLPVSVKHICGFARMRKYKPYRSVVESLKKSTFLDIIDDKYIQRKVPLALTPTVAPQSEEDCEKKAKKAPTQHPAHMTKGMRKPTGFEEYFTDPPITPGIFAQEQELYDADISFTSRIETAICRFISKRKFHQRTAFIFNAFLKYGGIEGGQKQFGGGLEAKDLEERTAAEIAAITATHKIMDDIITNEDKWEVDFEGVAKGFLSSQKMLCHLSDETQSGIESTTNVLRNFYNYLLHHNVCPEYGNEIYAARRICEIANKELFDTIQVGAQLPCGFNTAVSRLHGGTFAGILSHGQTWDGADNFGGSESDSRDILMAAISAHGSQEQYDKAAVSEQFEVVYEEDTSFEVIGVEVADAETREIYEAARRTKPHLMSLGKLHCRKWTYPLARPSKPGLQKIPHTFTLFLEDSVLEHCFIGLKIEGLVRGLDIGLYWLDVLHTASPSYFVLLPNEFYDKQEARNREEARIYGNECGNGTGNGELTPEPESSVGGCLSYPMED